MRKLFGISLCAILTVVPVMANAADGDRDVHLNKFNAVVGFDPGVASVDYVNESFKKSADKIDLLIDDTAVTADGNYIGAGKSVSANLGYLDSGLNDVSEVVSEHATTLATLTGSDDGSISKQIATALSGVSGNAGNLEDLGTEEKNSLVGAINEVNEVANDNADEIEIINSKKIQYLSSWSDPEVKEITIYNLQ